MLVNVCRNVTRQTAPPNRAEPDPRCRRPCPRCREPWHRGELCKRLTHLLEVVLAPLNVARGQVGGIRVIRAVARKERDVLAALTRRYPGGENGFPSIYALTVQTFLQ